MTNLIALMPALLVAFLVMSTSSTKQFGRPRAPTAQKPQFSGCGKNVYDKKIVGGQRVDVDGKFPWVVALLKQIYGTTWDQFCGGAIISNRHILTASHCVEKGMRPNQVMVRLGESNMNSQHASPSRRDVAVSKIFMHEGYDEKTMFHDIAILLLDERIPSWTAMIRPICLPTATALNLEGKMATVAGWGDMEEDSEVVTEFLMEVDLSIIEVSQCQKAYRFGMTILKEQICAGYLNGGKDSCQGDSGGPLMFRMDRTKPWTVLGVVSYGYPGCAREGIPTVYARVESYLAWIQSKMAIK